MVVQEKKLVDEVSGWLRLYDDGSVDRTWTGPPEVKFMSEPVPPHHHFVHGVSTRDFTIDPKSGLKVRVYLPEPRPDDAQLKQKLPVFLHLHGGGFCISRADWFMYYNTYTNLARSANAVVVSVYLRLAPEHRLPAACEDGFSALSWLASLAADQNDDDYSSSVSWLSSVADFQRVFLIGDSSGGNLVHQVAVRAGSAAAPDLRPLKLAGAIPIHPGFVRSTRSRSEMEQPESPLLTLDMVDKFLGLALPVGSTKDHPITCPMGPGAPAMKGMKLPPYLMVVAEKDLVKDTEMEFYEAMKEAGKEVELLINGGMGHSFYLNKIALDFDPLTADEFRRMIDGIVQFVNGH
ncbi:Probable carboxylesterase 17 [Linum grandiflorum]